jgi:hypothetical protein
MALVNQLKPDRCPTALSGNESFWKNAVPKSRFMILQSG